MKNTKTFFLLPYILFGFIYVPLFAEEKNVSTEPQLKNILLEEYTAIHCSYCPDGHLRADYLKRVLGDRFYVMAVHASSLAVPAGSELDFRSPYGEQLYNLSGQGGMPSGAINRSIYPEYDDRTFYGYGRGDWSLLSKLQINDTAQVNLWAKALIDTTSRIMTIEVEAYYPLSVDPDTHHLHLAILENNLITRQTGSYEGPNYLHKHVLRDLVHGMQGDLVIAPAQGSFIKRTYTYNIPQNYNKTAPNLGNLEVLVFVSKDSVANILNTISVSPDFPGKTAPLAIKWGLSNMSDRYIYPYLSLGIENLSMEKITSVEVDLSYNGSKKTLTVEVDIEPHTYGQCHLDIDPFTLKKVNIYKVEMKKLNGKEYFKEPISGQFFEPTAITSPKIKIEFITDAYSSQENAYYIKDDKGEIIYQQTEFSKEAGVKTLSEHDLVPGKNYSLEITDNFLDGFSGNTAGVRVLDKDGVQLHSTPLGAGFGEIYAFVYKPLSVEDNIAESASLSLWPNPAKEEIFVSCPQTQGNWVFSISDLQGRILYQKEVQINQASSEIRFDVADLPAGLYILSASMGSQNNITKFQIIK